MNAPVQSAQEMFDRIASHIAAQGYRSIMFDGPDDYVGLCLYRDGRGGCCAAGCVILNKDYDPRMERSGVIALFKDDLLPSYLIRHRHLLSRLQNVHDAENTWDHLAMPIALRSVASEFGLDASILDRLDFGTILPTRLD